MIRRIFILPAIFIMLAVAVSNVNAAGEGARTEAVAMPEAELATAPVEIDGQVLFRVRGASSFPAEQRAEAIKERIEAVAADKTIRSDMLRVVDADNVATILAGDRLLMVVVEGDARLEQLGRNYLANTHLKRIRTAIDDYRRMRSRDALLQGGLYTLGATVVLALGIVLLVFLGRWLDKVLSERAKSRIRTFGIQSFEIVRAEQIWKALHGMLYAVRIGAILVLLYVYLHLVLALFPWTRGIANQLFGLVTGGLGHMGKAIVARIPDLIILAIIYYLFRFVLRLIRHFFEAVDRKTVTLSGFDAEWAVPTYKIVRFGVIAFGLIVAYPYIPGSQSAAFKGISLFVGVVFSLGSSTAISNIIAGYLMTYRRVFKVGDRVKVGDVIGDVIATRLQVTHVLTLKNEEVTIPNSQILTGNVMNFSSMAGTRGLILYTTVGIGYETPWRQVEAMLLLAAERTPGLLREPRPFILLKGLGDFAVNYELNVYCDTPHEIAWIYAELQRRILDVFNEYGVQIMTPAYRADTPEPKVVPPEQWYAAPANPESGVSSQKREEPHEGQ
ncbi:MAG TPA: mechanosensitive ion channel family protein [Geobacteraceae bacterium]|nr:mechanosensitive ion channel family protein [Geobacteraceae bacterium]